MRLKTNQRHQITIKVLPILTIVSAGLFVSACTSNLAINFPIPDEVMLEQARLADTSADMATLQQGRILYLTKCTACHRAEPIGKYSLADWREILPDMSEESKFNARDEKAVSLYVLSYRQMLSRMAATPQ